MGQLLQLFLSFAKISTFTFGGGYAMIPLIQREVIERRHWIEREQFLDLLALAQSAPGPIALNTSVFVGYKIRGIRGALAAISGIVVPCFVIILLIAMFFADIRHDPVVEAVFKGMRPAVVALIAAPILSLSKGLGWVRSTLAILAVAAAWYFGFSPMYLILAGAGGGLLYGLYNAKKKIP